MPQPIRPWARPSRLARCIALSAALLPAVLLGSGTAAAAPGDKPVPPLTTPAADDKERTRTVSLPARGLFKGDQLTDSARSQLTELILNALGLQVEVALLVPVGPWQIDGSGQGERDLTPARLQALRKYLSDRGIEPHRIFVESRIDPKLSEPRLDVQLVGNPASD